MAPVTDTDPLVPLRDGFVAHASVLVWLIDASFRLDFRIDKGSLVVKPTRAITPSDDRFIRAHKDELLRAVEYVEQLARVPV